MLQKVYPFLKKYSLHKILSDESQICLVKILQSQLGKRSGHTSHFFTKLRFIRTSFNYAAAIHICTLKQLLSSLKSYNYCLFKEGIGFPIKDARLKKWKIFLIYSVMIVKEKIENIDFKYFSNRASFMVNPVAFLIVQNLNENTGSLWLSWHQKTVNF